MTTRDLRWLLTVGKPSPALKAATLLYLHGVRISASVRLRVGEVYFTSSPTKVEVDGSHLAYVTNELSNVLRGLATDKSPDDLLLGYRSVPEFHAEFRRMVRSARFHNFDLSDISEMFKAATGGDYPLLKQYESAEPFTPEDVRRAWLKVLPRLVVGA